MVRFAIGFVALVAIIGHPALAQPDIAEGIGTAFAAGMTVAMSAIDTLSQGAAIRGGSETNVDAFGQKLNDKKNMETGFGQAILPGGSESDESGEERKKREALPCGAGGGRGGGTGGGAGGGGGGAGGDGGNTDAEGVGGGEGDPARLQQRAKRNRNSSKRGRRAIQPVVDPYAAVEYSTTGASASASDSRKRRSPDGNFTTQVGRFRREVGQMPDGEPGQGGSFADGVSSALSRFVDAAKKLASRVGEFFQANDADGMMGVPEDVETLSA